MNIVWLDIETTGLNHGQILSIGAVCGEREFHAYNKVEIVSGEIDAILMNAETLRHCKDGIDACRAFYDWVNNLPEGDYTLGGKNVAFDVDWLSNRIGKRVGRSWTVGKIRFGARVLELSSVCGYVFDKMLSLRELCSELGVEYGEHNALADAKCAKACYERMVNCAD